jgi:hypothetical protein
MIKDARYFTHDSNARNDSKHRAMMKKYGLKGYGIFWVIIENMRDSSGYKIIEKTYVLESLAEQTDCTVIELRAFINDCIDIFELFIRQDDYFYSESLIARMAKLEAIRDKNRTAAYIMHTKMGHNITKDNHESDNDND